jgi:hypothetical protein
MSIHFMKISFVEYFYVFWKHTVQCTLCVCVSEYVFRKSVDGILFLANIPPQPKMIQWEKISNPLLAEPHFSNPAYSYYIYLALFMHMHSKICKDITPCHSSHLTWYCTQYFLLNSFLLPIHFRRLPSFMDVFFEL